MIELAGGRLHLADSPKTPSPQVESIHAPSLRRSTPKGRRSILSPPLGMHDKGPLPLWMGLDWRLVPHNVLDPGYHAAAFKRELRRFGWTSCISQRRRY